jgi:hypothetical protein
MPVDGTEHPARGFDDDGFERLARPVPEDLVAVTVAALVELTADRSARRRAGVSRHTGASGLTRLVLPRPVPAVLTLAATSGLRDQVEGTGALDAPVIWGAEVLTKPGAGPGAPIGWHQDRPYFHWWSGPTATLWVALTEMVPDCGAVRYVVGSHRWGDRFGTSDFDRTPEETRAVGPPPGETWTEAEVLGPPGTAVLHHPATIHGSGPNQTGRARLALALRLRSATTVLREDTPSAVRRVLGAEAADAWAQRPSRTARLQLP